jgi:hypothetical protein
VKVLVLPLKTLSTYQNSTFRCEWATFKIWAILAIKNGQVDFAVGFG